MLVTMQAVAQAVSAAEESDTSAHSCVMRGRRSPRHWPSTRTTTHSARGRRSQVSWSSSRCPARTSPRTSWWKMASSHRSSKLVPVAPEADHGYLRGDPRCAGARVSGHFSESGCGVRPLRPKMAAQLMALPHCRAFRWNPAAIGVQTVDTPASKVVEELVVLHSQRSTVPIP